MLQKSEQYSICFSIGQFLPQISNLSLVIMLMLIMLHPSHILDYQDKAKSKSRSMVTRTWWRRTACIESTVKSDEKHVKHFSDFTPKGLKHLSPLLTSRATPSSKFSWLLVNESLWELRHSLCSSYRFCVSGIFLHQLATRKYVQSPPVKNLRIKVPFKASDTELMHSWYMTPDWSLKFLLFSPPG